MTRFWRWFWALLIGIPIVALSAWGLQDNARLFVITLLNGLTLAALVFVVASGFTLVFGLMRNVSLAHGSLYLLGGYLGFFTAQFTGSWLLALAAGFAAAALVGLAMQVSIFRFMPGQDLRETRVTIALSIVIADSLMWAIGAQVHQMSPPAWLDGPIRNLPVIRAYSTYRLSLLPIGIVIGVALWLFLNRTRVGMMIRAGVDDRGMLAAAGVNVNLVFATTFAIGAGLAGFGGVLGAGGVSVVPRGGTPLVAPPLVGGVAGGGG